MQDNPLAFLYQVATHPFIFPDWAIVSQHQSRTWTGSKGSSHHSIDIDIDIQFERLHCKVRAHFQLLVMHMAYSPWGRPTGSTPIPEMGHLICCDLKLVILIVENKEAVLKKKLYQYTRAPI
jgi:hypothetical protein